jgi:hypothetical protein
MDATKSKEIFLHLAYAVRWHKDIAKRRYTQDTQSDASFLYFSTKIADVLIKRIFRPHVYIAIK